MFSDNRCDGATWKMNSETEGTGATHLPWPSDGWRNSCFHLCPVIWNVCTLNRGLGNKYFPKWAVYLHGASLTAWALYCLMTWVIHFRCNIKCPCAFCTPLIHGVSDWMGDNKWNDTRINWHYLNSKVVGFFLSFPVEVFPWAKNLKNRGSQDSSQVNLSNLVSVDVSLHPLIDPRHVPLASGFA